MKGIPGLLNQVNEYYTKKLDMHGATPEGVDWNGEKGQLLRFQKLLSFLNIEKGDSLLDFGCGYGALLDYIQATNNCLEYYGFDISHAMITAAQERHGGLSGRFLQSIDAHDSFSFIVLSGVFNVRGVIPESDWTDYVKTTLEDLLQKTGKALAFNLLSKHSPLLVKRGDLYYANSFMLLDELLLNPRYRVFIDHSYSDWEFTVTIVK